MHGRRGRLRPSAWRTSSSPAVRVGGRRLPPLRDQHASRARRVAGCSGRWARAAACSARRTMWDELGGLDERFALPGGGLVNHDLYRRACDLPRPSSWSCCSARGRSTSTTGRRHLADGTPGRDARGLPGDPGRAPPAATVSTLHLRGHARHRRRCRSSSARLARPSTGRRRPGGRPAGDRYHAGFLDDSRRLASLNEPTRGGRAACRTLPIAITGMHRSGTSMITRALHDSGLHLIGDRRRGAHRRGRGQPRGVLGEQGDRRLQRRAARGDRGRLGQPARPPAAGRRRSPGRAHRRRQHVGPRRAERARPLGVQGSADVPDRGLLARPRARPAVHRLRAPPARGGAVAQAPQPELVLPRPRAVGALLRHACSSRSPPSAGSSPTTTRSSSIPRARSARLCAFAGLEPAPPRVRTDLRHHTIGVDLGDAGVSAEPAGALRRAVPRGRRAAAPERAASTRAGCAA